MNFRHKESVLENAITNHVVRTTFNQWMLDLDHGPDRFIYPNLRTYLIKTVRDYIELENQDGSFINDVFSTWEIVIRDIHIESEICYNWAESIDLSLYNYPDGASERVRYAGRSGLSERQKSYLKNTANQVHDLVS